MTQTQPRFSIVAAYDFSDLAELALDRAISMALQQARADLHVLGVLDSRGNLKPGHKSDYAAADEVQAELEAVLKRKIPGVTSNSLHLYIHARIGNPAEQILNLASEANADVIIVGTHGHTGMKRWMLGSVAERVVRFAGCPVVVMREKTYHPEAVSEWQPEPPCKDCMEAREQSEGKDWWCETHRKPNRRPHRYSYHGSTDASDHVNTILW